MRTIKFRYWDKINKVMIENIHDSEEFWLVINNNLYDVMQYTGLKDKNGKEIYEGDIIEGRVGDIEGFDVKGIVVYCECGYYFIKEKDDETMIHIVDNLEVIGNIYDNPELLEEGE